MPMDFTRMCELLEELQKIVRESGKPSVVAAQRPEPEPHNNDGRRRCWWCRAQTAKKQGFTGVYDICPKCEK